jgi:hypothetical protein
MILLCDAVGSLEPPQAVTNTTKPRNKEVETRAHMIVTFLFLTHPSSTDSLALTSYRPIAICMTPMQLNRMYFFSLTDRPSHNGRRYYAALIETPQLCKRARHFCYSWE